MEGDQVSVAALPSQEEPKEKKIKFGEILDEWCAFYMSIGVPYDEYWYGDYTRLKFYYKAWELKTTREVEMNNQSAYLAGLYNYNAFSSVMAAFGWALGGKKGSKPDGYMQHPIAITENEKRAEQERNAQRTIEWFMKGQEVNKDG